MREAVSVEIGAVPILRRRNSTDDARVDGGDKEIPLW